MYVTLTCVSLYNMSCALFNRVDNVTQGCSAVWRAMASASGVSTELHASTHSDSDSNSNSTNVSASVSASVSVSDSASSSAASVRVSDSKSSSFVSVPVSKCVSPPCLYIIGLGLGDHKDITINGYY